MLNDNNFFFCETCQQVSYAFDCCENTVCNGSGCEECDKIWDEAHKAILIGQHPPVESLRKTPGIDELFNRIAGD